LCLFFSNELDLPVSSNTLFLPSSGWLLTFTSDGPHGLDQELAKADTQGGRARPSGFTPGNNVASANVKLDSAIATPINQFPFALQNQVIVGLLAGIADPDFMVCLAGYLVLVFLHRHANLVCGIFCFVLSEGYPKGTQRLSFTSCAHKHKKNGATR